MDRRDRVLFSQAVSRARRGRPSPNPHVGAVVADPTRAVVGCGHHERAGLAHAEVAALAEAGERARGGTLYVTLEPCCHHGRTGPCTDAIIAAGIRRVVIGCRDPNPRVDGRGIELLRAAGVAVDLASGALAERAHARVEDFAKHITRGLPGVTLKAAVTLDGRIATRTGDSRWITSEPARRLAHRLRDRHDAVLVGVGTVLADDPELTVRMVSPRPGACPLRVVLDTHLRTPSDAKLVTGASEAAPVVIVHACGSDDAAARLARPGLTIVRVEPGSGGVHVEQALRSLASMGIVSLLVEGGGEVHASFLEGGWADRLALFLAPSIVGGREARPFVGGRGAERMGEAFRVERARLRRVGDDWILRGRLRRPGAEAVR
ncbi:MAG: bifunctional diaminohydroxyphosphoribosylaminopyrimidine deaminase/5-amino-6-(5-phosphoribosylamino)uracil reductase RibD [Deltaproteobacteria bacterium]|nr:bifunctional diaminohydroxyphosphoribosylaminopyrimidine deaminase/5-amino-6-(5-phosphoribosylamino)uracil reductase RibD [Deltaproteobacteria bacterium]